MNILLIWPNKDNFGFKPMNIALITAILKQNGHEVALFDTTFIDFGRQSDNKYKSRIRVFKPVNFNGYDVRKKKVDLETGLLKKLDDFRPDIVGVSALSDEVFIGLEISRIIKQWKSDVPIVWGNKAATMAPEKILANPAVDYICVGEGIEFIKEFADCIASGGNPKNLKNIAYLDENGQVCQNKLKPYFQELDTLPYYDWSLFDQRQFLKVYDGKIYTGGDHMIHWGCPNHCTYCINHAYRRLYGKNAGRWLRWYNVDRIIAELQYLVDKWGITFFKFYDEDFCIKPIAYFRELAEKYEKAVNVPFTAMANARNLTEEKVGLLVRMNCVSVSIGIETGNEILRHKILKRSETTADIICGIKLLNAAGIRTSTFNMLGIPFENRRTIMETVEVNRKSKVRYPNTVFFYPLEGTELRQTAIENGFFKESNKLTFDSTVPALTFSDISNESLIALRERFVLYVKMPYEYHKYIERSEKADETGRKLSKELYAIYDKCVLANNGIWRDGGKSKYYLGCLGGCFK